MKISAQPPIVETGSGVGVTVGVGEGVGEGVIVGELVGVELGSSVGVAGCAVAVDLGASAAEVGAGAGASGEHATSRVIITQTKTGNMRLSSMQIRFTQLK